MENHNSNAQTLRGVLCVLIGGCCWAFSGSCGQYLFMHYNVNPVWLTAVRMLLSGGMITVYMLLRHMDKVKTLISNRKDSLVMLAYAVLGLMLTQFTYFEAINSTNAGTATVLEYIGPVLIMMVVCVANKRLPTLKEGLSICLVVVGIFFIATHGDWGNVIINHSGLFWGLFSAVAMVFYTLLPKTIMPKYGTIMVTGIGILLGGLVFCAITQPWPLRIELPADGVLALMGIVTLGTLVAFPLYLQGVNDIGPVKASMLAGIEPVCATILSVVWLDSVFVIQDFIGFVCILATVFLLSNDDAEVQEQLAE